MVSLYSSITVAQLEARMGKDYSSLDANLTDSVIENMAITPAEIYAEAYTGAIPSSSSSNIVLHGIAVISDRILEFQLQHEGVINTTNPPSPVHAQELSKWIYLEDVLELFRLSKQESGNQRSFWIEEG